MSFRPLADGARVRVVQPAHRLSDADLQSATRALRDVGIEVDAVMALAPGFGRLSADDAARAAELQAAFRDPRADALLIGQGGFGCTRLLGLLDWDAIAAHPKPLIGFSDVTALLIPAERWIGANALHGPTARTFARFVDQPSLECLAAVLRGRWGRYNELLRATQSGIRVLRGGSVTAPVVGGNLSLLGSLIGTPFDFATEGRILFVEDWKEPQYRIDRMLTQLHLAGRLDRIAGFVLGEMAEITRIGEDIAETIEQRVMDLVPASVPVIAGVPCGHGTRTMTLMMGAHYRLDGDGLTFAEG